MIELRTIPLSEISIDGGTQMRVELNENVVADYAQSVRDGQDLPPIVVYFDGAKSWLGDGFHRFHAYGAAGAVEIDADVRQGTRREAILHAVGANAGHGVHRTSADKRKAVETLLADAEWAQWPQTKIAEACNVSQPFVSRIVASLAEGASYSQNKTKEAVRDGKPYQIDTTNIGKGRTAVAQDESAKAERQAQQVEHDRQREEARAALPEAVQQADAAKEAAIAARRGAGTPDVDADRAEELEQAVQSLQATIDGLQSQLKTFEPMRVQWEQGGFEKVVAGKDEEIRVLKRQVEMESAHKASFARTTKHLQKLLQETGYTKDVVIDAKTGVMSNG